MRCTCLDNISRPLDRRYAEEHIRRCGHRRTCPVFTPTTIRSPERS